MKGKYAMVMYMKIIKYIVAIVSFVGIFFIRWNSFGSKAPMPDIPTINWSTVPFYYPNFYHPGSCCGVAGPAHPFPAFWSVSGFFILLGLYILINLVLFFIINKFSKKTI